jgi:hypothetical protein
LKRIALLIAANVASDAPNRRADAWLYEVELKTLQAAFPKQGLSVEPIYWGADVDWRSFDAALVMCAWDYQDQSDRFLVRIDELARLGVKVFNPPDLVRWNIRKTYLRDFEARGVPIIPTLWPEAPTADDLHDAFAKFDTDDIVLKRQIGGGARAQERYSRVTTPDAGSVMDRPGMIQPVIQSVITEGEYSFLFIDGEFSHALIKRAKQGDYRIQAAYGGVSSAITPEAIDQKQARAVLDALDEPPLYARVDMVRGADGELLLMELEVIEPFLFPDEGPRIGDMYARALKKRLG